MEEKYKDLPPDLPPDADGEYLENKYQEGRKNEGRKQEERSQAEGSELIIKIETLEGRLQAESERRAATDERISRLSEEIGELRSMILERERSIGNIEAGFEKIRDQLGEVKPELISKDLEKKEQTILETAGRMDKVEDLLDALRREVSGFREQVGKIRSFDNIIQMYDELNKKIAKIQESEQYVNRMSAKVESIFSELDKRIPEIVEFEEKTKTLQEVTTDLMKSLDKDEVKLKEAVYKEDLQKLQTGLEDKIKKFESDTSDSVKKIDEFGKSFIDLEKKIDIISGIGEKMGGIEKRLDEAASAVDVLGKNRLNAQDLEDRLGRLEAKEEKIGAEFKEQVRASVQQARQPRGYELEDIVSRIRKQQLVARNIEMEKRLHELEASIQQTKSYLEEGKFEDKPLAPKKKSEQIRIVVEELRNSIGTAHELIEHGKLGEAKEAYLKIWDAYGKLNDACDNKGIVEPVYKDIRRLHKRLDLEEKAGNVEELAKTSEGLLEKDDLDGAQARYLEAMEAYGAYNKESRNIERKNSLHEKLAALHSKLEEKGGKADPAEVIKKSVSDALELVDSGKLDAANESYMRIFETYTKLKETNKDSTEAAYPAIESLHNRLELEKKIGEMDGTLNEITKQIESGDLKGAQKEYLEAMALYGEYNKASKDVGRKNSIFEKLTGLHDRLDAAMAGEAEAQ